jgi:hypothetical protein
MQIHAGWHEQTGNCSSSNAKATQLLPQMHALRTLAFKGKVTMNMPVVCSVCKTRRTSHLIVL